MANYSKSFVFHVSMDKDIKGFLHMLYAREICCQLDNAIEYAHELEWKKFAHENMNNETFGIILRSYRP